MKKFVAETYYLIVPKNFFLGKSKKTLLKKRFLCSFSGGQDSTLVFFLVFHKKQLSQTLDLLYFHHFWQIQNFQASKGIFHLSFNLKIPYTILISNLPLANENRSRNWRKKKLFRFSTFQKTSLVLTGHTQTDSLETNLNNLIRGTSLKGICFPNFFGEWRKERFYSSQNYSKQCYYPVTFWKSFVILKLLTQAKQINLKKKNRLKSKIFFSKANQLSKFFIFYLFETLFFRKANLATKKLQKLKNYNWKIYETGFQFKVFPKNQMRRCPQKSLLNPIKKTVFHTKNDIFGTSKKLCFFDGRPKIFEQGPGFNEVLPNLTIWKREGIAFFRKKKLKSSSSFSFFNFSEKQILKAKMPLKNHTRITVSKITKIYNLPVFHDLTNFSYHCSRNKIRHIVFPLIGYLFQKKIDFSFTQFFSILRNDTWESENSSEKLYFLFYIFSIPNCHYSNLSENSNNLLTLSAHSKLFTIGVSRFNPDTKIKVLRKGQQMLPDRSFFVQEKETKTTIPFEKFLLLYVCKKNQIAFQLYIIKQLIRDYTERELSFNYILTIQKIIAL